MVESHSDWAAEQLNRGQWLRLKPPRPGAFGPSSRCALVSQQEAVKLLSNCGIDHETSDCYSRTWEAEFKNFVADKERERAQKQKQLSPQLDRLKVEFPKLASFLHSNLDQVGELAEPASNEDIMNLERAIEERLPTEFRKFLTCTSALVYSDFLQIGLQLTFRHPDDPALPSARRVCFGEYWLDGDGDQVLFGESEAEREPPVLYYNHAEPSVRELADNFTAWLESLPGRLNE